MRVSFLEIYPSVRTTSKEWRRRFPKTLLLMPLPGYLEVIPARRGRIVEGIPTAQTPRKDLYQVSARPEQNK